MKKWVVFLICLSFSISMVSFPAEALAQSSSTISLAEQYITYPGSDIELIATSGGKVYAIVSYSGEYRLFRSDNQGKSWQKLPGQGLPERERFISFRVASPEIMALSTTTKVYLSRDGGSRFDCLGGPLKLTERGEEITSLAISGGMVLVGIWNPAQGKLAEDGVYLWGIGGKAEWQPQGMRLVWQGKSYNADVAAVGFWQGYILAVATGDPEGPLPEGTYLNIAQLGQRGIFGIGLAWNYLSDWPIEVSQTAGQSPKETEIINSKMVFSEFDWQEGGRIYIIYNSRQKVKDDVYRIELSERYLPKEVRKLQLPRAPELISLDSIDYSDKTRTLVVGTTTKSARTILGDGIRLEYRIGPTVYSLPTNLSVPEWEGKWMETTDTQNCQVAISPDDKIIFAGTSGSGSCFARAEQDILIPTSLIDASPGVNQLAISQKFLEDKTLFLNYGDRSVFKARLAEGYQLSEVQRMRYFSESFDPARLKIEISDQNLFLFELGTKRFWRSQNGRSWSNLRTEMEIIDARVMGGKIWIASKDGMAYLCSLAGSTQARLTSGMDWLGKVELGPEGKVIMVGGKGEWLFEGLSLIGEGFYQMLPSLPVTVSSPAGFKVVYSPKEKAIYYAVNNQLYRLSDSGVNWEKVAELNWGIADLLLSPQGFYIFTRTEIYFTSFPLGRDSKWKKAEGLKGNWLGCKLVEVDEKSNLFILWDSTKIMVQIHQIPEPKPATFATTDLSITPPQVDIGQQVTISVTVTNVGELAGSCNVTLKIDDVAVATKSVTLAANAKQKVIFAVSKDIVKTYTVTVENLSGTFTVKTPPPPPPKPPAQPEPPAPKPPEVTKPVPTKPPVQPRPIQPVKPVQPEGLLEGLSPVGNVILNILGTFAILVGIGCLLKLIRKK